MGPSRREFLKSASVAGAMAVAGGSARSGGASAQAQSDAAVLRSVETDVLEIGYEESGDPAGFPIILLHGFPYDIRSWDGVVPPLADAGYRVLVPYLRGYGTTRFLDPEAPRMAEQAAIAQDVSDFAAALGLEQVALAGFDWGNRAACITSILHPERVRAQVAIGGYSVQDTVSPSAPSPSAAAEARLWYQWYFNTERGRAGLEANRHAIVRYLWETWSPTWEYTDEAYNRSAPAFDNPDFVDVVIHSYRHRHGYAPGRGALSRRRARARRTAADHRAGHRAAGQRQRLRPAVDRSDGGSGSLHQSRRAPDRGRGRTRSGAAAAGRRVVGIDRAARVGSSCPQRDDDRNRRLFLAASARTRASDCWETHLGFVRYGDDPSILTRVENSDVRARDLLQ